ncbi:YebC/PmpR family DNA-binding transcriptional regulator [Blattabacterium cuenoti]|uniref:YebC/PmpR family DNA-binding transcriptional regulator n=1 Tax=Blattabacterium cuenoti TaxID=1653831 RepID=UPI00163C7B47|nr:YebC/PmpR family DNA-binding transcriptional regulator [Blattabacterium cuenoti]
MSGHSKWSNIQHRKSNKDFIKSKKFSKIIKEISIAVKEKNKTSFRLKNAILNAKSINVPKQTIERTIQKASKIKKNYKNLSLEGQIHGISLIIECITDNSVRTISNIRTFLNKKGGRLCHNGEIIHLFNRIGIFSIRKNDIHFSLEDFELMLIDFGAKDIFKEKEKVSIYTDFEYFGSMKNNLEKLKIPHLYQIKRISIQQKKNITKENEKKILNLIEVLEKNEDIQNVYSNLI